MTDPVAELLKIEVRLADLARGFSEKALASPPEDHPEADIWCDYGFKWPAYAFAHLYRTEHPENPHFRAEWCLELAVALLDKCTEAWEWRKSHGMQVASREVPHYVAATLIEWLGDDVPESSRAGWVEHAEAWAEQALARPFGFTGTYHDAWRLLSLFRLGRAMDRLAWREAAVFFFKRMMSYQTAEGCWEESRGHGPSMRYNGLMLPALAWMYRLTGDGEFRESAARLAAFMAIYSYPDAITVGPFDGRNSPMMAFFPNCAGLELAPEGRVLAARAFKLWRDLGSPESPDLIVESTRDAVRVAFYAADTCVYLSDYVPEKERAAAADESGKLPVEVRGKVENHTAAFDGLLHKSGAWVLALSAQNSDVPRITQSVYRLERQSRIELWHRSARLVLGGGHSLRETPLPYCNAVLDTGYAGPSDFGRLPMEGFAALAEGRRQPGRSDGRPAYNLCQSYFAPQMARAWIENGEPRLQMHFAHGIIDYRFRLGERCEIEAGWEGRNLHRLALQIPVVVWHGARLLLDGAELTGDAEGPFTVEREVRVEGGPFGAGYALRVPDGVPCRVHWPLAAHPALSSLFEEDAFKPAFAMALASCQWESPEPSGRARFSIGVTA